MLFLAPLFFIYFFQHYWKCKINCITFVAMNLRNYYRQDNNVFASMLRNHLGIRWEQKHDIEDFLRSNGYVVVKAVKYTKPARWWRLTVPFFILLCVLMLVTVPFKWMLTGYGKYNDASWIGRLWCGWNNKLGLI